MIHFSATTCQNGANFIASIVSKVAGFLFGWAVRPIYTRVTYYNKVRGERFFAGFPRCLEKFIGWVVHGIGERNAARSFEQLLDGRPIAPLFGTIFRNLAKTNEALLSTNKNNYRLTVVKGFTIKAFSYGNGEIQASTELATETEGYLASETHPKTEILLADGAKVEINLSDVKLEDAVAGVLAHEQIHVATRHHSVTLILKSIALLLTIYGAYYFICQFLEKFIQAKTDYYLNGSIMENTVDAVASIALMITVAICTEHRRKEYEADVGGVFSTTKAEYNPLGLILFFDLLEQKTKGTLSSWFHKNFEYLHTHPNHENRKRSLLAAIMEIAPEKLEGRVTYIPPQTPTCYDIELSSPAIQFADRVAKLFGNTENVA